MRSVILGSTVFSSSSSFPPTGITLVFSSNENEGLKCQKKNMHMQPPCATIKTEFAIQQIEPGFMDSGSNMKRSLVIFLRSIRTSCDVGLKLALLSQGATV